MSVTFPLPSSPHWAPTITIPGIPFSVRGAGAATPAGTLACSRCDPGRQLRAIPALLTHLERLEAESIHIMREVVAEAETPGDALLDRQGQLGDAATWR